MKQKMQKKEMQEQKKTWQDGTAARIAGKILKVQALISRMLQNFERRLTVKQKKIGLFIFCLFCSIYLLYMLGNALFFEKYPKYHDFFREQEKTLPLQDPGDLLNTSLK